MSPRVVVRRSPLQKGTKPAQQAELLLAEAGDVGDGFRPGQHSQQAQKQDLGQRIHHLAALARVRQILEIAQKNNRLPKRRATFRLAAHHRAPTANQWNTTDSAHHSLVTPSFTRLP